MMKKKMLAAIMLSLTVSVEGCASSTKLGPPKLEERILHLERESPAKAIYKYCVDWKWLTSKKSKMYSSKRCKEYKTDVYDLTNPDTWKMIVDYGFKLVVDR